MRRGEIWWASLDDPMGAEPGYRRPVVIVSSNLFNERGLNTVLTIPTTTNLARETPAGNVRLPATRQTGLSRPSVAMTIHLQATDRRRLTELVGRVPSDLMNRIDDALRLVLAL